MKVKKDNRKKERIKRKKKEKKINKKLSRLQLLASLDGQKKSLIPL